MSERLEYARQISSGNAGAGIGDGHRALHELFVVRIDLGAHMQGHLAMIGVLDGIADQIDHDLTQTARVEQQGIGHIGIDFMAQAQAFFHCHLREHRLQRREQFAQIGRSQFDFKLAGLDARQVKNVIDQVEQGLAALLDRFDIEALAFTFDDLFEQLGEAEDRIHRRADFVAHVGQERSFLVVCTDRTLRLRTQSCFEGELTQMTAHQPVPGHAGDEAEQGDHEDGPVALLDQADALIAKILCQCLLIECQCGDVASQLTHQRLAEITANVFDRGVTAGFVKNRDGHVHLHLLVLQLLANGSERNACVRVTLQLRGQVRNKFRQLSFGIAIRRQISDIAGQEVATLAGLHIDQHARKLAQRINALLHVIATINPSMQTIALDQGHGGGRQNQQGRHRHQQLHALPTFAGKMGVLHFDVLDRDRTVAAHSTRPDRRTK